MTQATTSDLTFTFHVDRTPLEAYAAVIDTRSWWSQTITGETDRVGGDFEYEVPGVHYSKIRVVELEPGVRVRWRVVDAHMTFVADPTEWTDTEVLFEFEPTTTGTRVRFTHFGLTPEVECYDACNTAWGSYVGTSLRGLIEDGVGLPNQERSGGRLEREADDRREEAARLG
jgi:hypothetical protein